MWFWTNVCVNSIVTSVNTSTFSDTFRITMCTTQVHLAFFSEQDKNLIFVSHSNRTPHTSTALFMISKCDSVICSVVDWPGGRRGWQRVCQSKIVALNVVSLIRVKSAYNLPASFKILLAIDTRVWCISKPTGTSVYKLMWFTTWPWNKSVWWHKVFAGAKKKKTFHGKKNMQNINVPKMECNFREEKKRVFLVTTNQLFVLFSTRVWMILLCFP